jgi:hypothetical protein
MVKHQAVRLEQSARQPPIDRIQLHLTDDETVGLP